METNNFGKVLGALLIGAAIGGVAGILFAPDKGSRTRRKILSKSEDITDAMKDKFDDFLEKAKEELESANAKANEYLGNGITKAEKMKTF